MYKVDLSFATTSFRRVFKHLRPVQRPLTVVVETVVHYVCYIFRLSFLKEAADSESCTKNINENMEETKASETEEDTAEEMPDTKQDHHSSKGLKERVYVQKRVLLHKVCTSF